MIFYILPLLRIQIHTITTMGNVTAAEHAVNVFRNFSENLTTKNLKPDVSDEEFSTVLKHDFGVFLEDILVNDKTYESFSDEEKPRFLGALCYYFTVTLISANQSSPKSISFTRSVGSAFCQAVPTEQLLVEFINASYAWNGESFCVWDGSSWTRCSQEAVNCDKLVAGIMSDVQISNFGINSEPLDTGITQIVAYLAALKEGARTLSSSQRYTETLDALKSKVVKFNGPSLTIPGFSSVVDVSRSASRCYEFEDTFTQRLPYDASTEETETVRKFTSSLDCSNEELATVLVSSGVSLGRNLTIVSGPKRSGKSAVLSLIKSLYGPFVCTQEDYESGTVNLEQVRTCLIDENSFPSEKFLREHKVDQLIVTCESCDLAGEFAGRKVKRLKLLSPIETVAPNIVKELSTRKQLGSLLGWSLALSDVESDNAAEEAEQSFLSMLETYSKVLKYARQNKERTCDDECKHADSDACPDDPESAHREQLVEMLAEMRKCRDALDEEDEEDKEEESPGPYRNEFPRPSA